MPHFECGAFDHSATSPRRQIGGRSPRGRGRVLGEDGWPDKARNDKSVKSCPTGRAKPRAISPYFLLIGHPHRLGIPIGPPPKIARSSRQSAQLGAGAIARFAQIAVAKKPSATVPIDSERWLQAFRFDAFSLSESGVDLAENGPSGQFKNLSLD
jgi:hypothetical protein